MKESNRYRKILYQIARGVKVLFIGTNPSPNTYEQEVPFSNNKSFWYLLSDAGLISESKEQLKDLSQLKQIYYGKFAQEYHLSIIPLVYRPSRTVAELSKSEALPGIARILKLIESYHPPVVCFIGKSSYQLFMQISHCTYGWQPSIQSSKVYVMHSPLHGFASTRIRELRIVAKAAGFPLHT